jgi:tRNA G18 (ribose-2'-O)-methylase SpoU
MKIPHMEYGKRQLILMAHNVRSCHNVGSLLRTADGLGAAKVYLTGYTPYPLAADDGRLPHEAAKIARQIHKTALGAEHSVPWRHHENILEVFRTLRDDGFAIAALEQVPDSVKLPGYQPPEKLAIVVGREVEGIEPEILAACDFALEVPMSGRKESFNVAAAAAMALYHCRFAK